MGNRFPANTRESDKTLQWVGETVGFVGGGKSIDSSCSAPQRNSSSILRMSDRGSPDIRRNSAPFHRPPIQHGRRAGTKRGTTSITGAIKSHFEAQNERGKMSTLRLYAVPLILILWAMAIDFLGNSKSLVVIRLVTVAVAAFISLRESVRNNNERKRRNGG